MGPGVRRECGFFWDSTHTRNQLRGGCRQQPAYPFVLAIIAMDTNCVNTLMVATNSMLRTKNSLRGVTKFPARDAGNCQRNASFHYVGVGSFGANAKFSLPAGNCAPLRRRSGRADGVTHACGSGRSSG